MVGALQQLHLPHEKECHRVCFVSIYVCSKKTSTKNCNLKIKCCMLIIIVVKYTIIIGMYVLCILGHYIPWKYVCNIKYVLYMCTLGNGLLS